MEARGANPLYYSESDYDYESDGDSDSKSLDAEAKSEPEESNLFTQTPAQITTQSSPR